MQTTTRVRFDTSGFDRFIRELYQQGATVEQVNEILARIYLSFTKRRFVREAAGGGAWAALQDITVERRKKGKRKGSAQILRDTGQLLNALDIGRHGNRLKKSPRGTMEVGFADTPHTGRGKGDAITYAELADIHQHGDESRNLPARPILVDPDDATKDTMKKTLIRAINQMANKGAMRPRG